MRMLSVTDNQSKFITDAILDKLAKLNDPGVIKARIKEHEDHIKSLKSQLKQGEVRTEEALERVNYWYHMWRDHWKIREDFGQIDRIKSLVVPDLRKHGFKQYNAKMILQIFKAHDQSGKVTVNL